MLVKTGENDLVKIENDQNGNPVKTHIESWGVKVVHDMITLS